MNQSTGNLDGYIRVSRSKSGGISPTVQRQAIEQWAKAHGHDPETITWHEELDRSGGAGKKRPVFDALLERVISGESAGIVVWKWSRFGRSLIESALRLEKIEKAHGTVYSATEGEQTTLTRNILLAIAEDELERLTEGWAASRKEATEKGLHMAKAPIGYVREDRRLVLDPGTWKVINQAFKLAASGGLHTAMTFLEAQVPDKRWRKSDVRRVLSNRVYLGEHHNGGPGHDPIVDPTTWQAAQTEPRNRKDSGDYPLSHVATCGKCGAGMTGGTKTNKGVSTRKMTCSGCGGCSISADDLEEYVRERLRGGGPYEYLRSLSAAEGLDEAQAEVKRLAAETRRFAADDDAREILGDREWRIALRARSAKRAEAEARYRTLARQEAETERLPAPEQLDDPKKLKAALSAFSAIVVQPVGRGKKVLAADRVTVDWNVAGVPDHLNG